jgi:hypothetical protein
MPCARRAPRAPPRSTVTAPALQRAATPEAWFRLYGFAIVERNTTAAGVPTMSSLSVLPKITGFFSYARADDKNSRGGLSELHNRIHSELCILLGRSETDLVLWKDTGEIPHGTLWQELIEQAVAGSIFFIPIVTPAAINSSFCQFEYEAFVRREAELGRSNLVFPILYIDVPELQDAQQRAKHPVLGILHERQYLDWRKFRHDDVTSAEIGRKIEAFCRDITIALRQPWLPPEERRQKEAEEAARAAEEAARLKAEAERRNSAQAIAQAHAAEERARQMAEAKRIAEETWRTVSQMARTRFETARQTIADVLANPSASAVADAGSGSDVERPIPAWKLVVMPWKPVETLQQARALTRFGVLWFALLAAVFLVIALAKTGGDQFIFLLAAAGSGVCAFGTSRNSRVAAIIGFVLSFLALVLLGPLFAFAAVKGASATRRLGGAAS